MTRRTRIILIAVATLGAVAWINAGQERRGCDTCSPTVGALSAMAFEFKIPPR